MTTPREHWRRFRGLSTWKQWLGWIVVVVAVIAAIPSPKDTKDAPVTVAAPRPETVTRAVTVTQPAAAVATATAAATVPTTTPRPTPTPPRPRRKRISRADVETGLLRGLDAKIVTKTPSLIRVRAKTPSGGFQGASTGDVNFQAADIFKALYRTGRFHRATVIEFKGGLVSTTTGRDLPDATTAIYSMSRQDASKIDWLSDDDLLNIRWQNFREFAHPALKQDENGFG